MSIELLGRLDLFSFCSPEQLELLAEGARSLTLEAGEGLFAEGDEGEEVFVVVDGRIRIHHALALDADRTLAELEPGALFGEAAIIDRDVRSASATAATASTVLLLDAVSLREFMLAHPDVGLLIMGRLASMMMERQRTTNDRLRDSMNWGLEVAGAAHLSIGRLVSEGATVELHLRGDRVVRGRVVRADKDSGALTLWVRTDDERIHLIPFHAITELISGAAVRGQEA